MAATRFNLLETSFHPPSAAPTRRRRPSWILLDALAYISDQSNATTAQCRTRDANQPINVTLCVAAPPCVSYLCVHCPGLDPADFATEPTVLAAEDRFVLLRVPIGQRTIQNVPMCNDYFIYQAGNTSNSRSSSSSMPPPSLLLLPNPGRISLPDNRTVFCIHKTISIGGRGGSMGWVDLWSGILVCDVLRKNPVLRYTPFPVIRYRSDLGPPRTCRDVVTVVGRPDQVLRAARCDLAGSSHRWRLSWLNGYHMDRQQGR
ncbi:hypothetical protein QOZ80_8AG0631670 [Eleusine coracana subsp. coracana]|nr:hypothetical protein QOZ80_8AG0631670 [Eleusine coracana subsp. coracana]